MFDAVVRILCGRPASGKLHGRKRGVRSGCARAGSRAAGRVVVVGTRRDDRGRDAPRFGDEVVLRTWSRSVNGIESVFDRSPRHGSRRNRRWPWTSRSGRLHVTAQPALRAVAATRRRPARRAVGASNSCGCRSPFRVVAGPGADQSEERRGCPSTPRDCRVTCTQDTATAEV